WRPGGSTDRSRLAATRRPATRPAPAGTIPPAASRQCGRSQLSFRRAAPANPSSVQWGSRIIQRSRRGVMSDHAHQLAAQFRQVNAEVIQFAQECSPENWRRMVPHEGRSVAYLIDHIAYAYGGETKIMLKCVTGDGQPHTRDELRPTFTM